MSNFITKTHTRKYTTAAFLLSALTLGPAISLLLRFTEKRIWIFAIPSISAFCALVAAVLITTGIFKDKLASKDGEIGGLEGQVKDKDGEIGKLEGQVKAKDGEIGRLEGQVKAKDGEIGRLEGQVKDKDEEIGRLEGQVKDKDGEIGRLEGQVKAKDGEIGRLEGQVKDKDENITSLNRNVESLKGTLNTQKESIASLNQQVESKDGEIESLNSQMKAKDENITSLKRDVESKDQKIKSLEKKIKSPKYQVQLHATKIDDTLNDQFFNSELSQGKIKNHLGALNDMTTKLSELIRQITQATNNKKSTGTKGNLKQLKDFLTKQVESIMKLQSEMIDAIQASKDTSQEEETIKTLQKEVGTLNQRIREFNFNDTLYTPETFSGLQNDSNEQKEQITQLQEKNASLQDMLNKKNSNTLTSEEDKFYDTVDSREKLNLVVTENLPEGQVSPNKKLNEASETASETALDPSGEQNLQVK